MINSTDLPPAPDMRLALQFHIKLGEPLVIGRIDEGVRRIVPILGGTFEGEDFKGDILPFGGDWQVVRDCGRMDLDARYTLRTDEGEHIFISNVGSRYIGEEASTALISGKPVNLVGTRSHGLMRAETGAERLRWMNDQAFIPRSRRGEHILSIDFYTWR